MQFFNGLERPIVFSLSPGVSATPLMANSVSSLVNTYRVTGDDWDEWSAILAHFNVARSLTKFFLYMFEFKIHGSLFHLSSATITSLILLISLSETLLHLI